MPNSPKRRRSSHSESSSRAREKHLLDKVYAELKDQLNIMWSAESDVTRKNTATSLHEFFLTEFEPFKTNSRACQDVSFIIFKGISAIILTDNALKVPINKDKEKKQYIETLRAMALLLHLMYSAYQPTETDESEEFVHTVESFEMLLVIKVFQTLASGLNAPVWGVRYRILQFISFFLEERKGAFSCFDEHLKQDIVRKLIFERSYDSNFRVAALAVDCIGYYQVQEDTKSAKKSKAFCILFYKMQEHKSPLVRYAATNGIKISPKSAPAIIRRVLDESPDVRILAYEIIGGSFAPKILKPELRSYLLLAGLTDTNASVRSAALACLEKWMTETGANYDEMIGGKGVGEDNENMYYRKPLDMLVFDSEHLYPLKENVPVQRSLPKRASSISSGRTSVSASPFTSDDTSVAI